MRRALTLAATGAAARAAFTNRPADLDKGGGPGERLRLPLRRKRQLRLGARAGARARRGAADTSPKSRTSGEARAPVLRVVGVRVVRRIIVGLVRRRLLRVLPVAARVQEAEYYVDGTDLTCVCLSRLNRVGGVRHRRETSRLAQSRDFLIVQICFDGAPSVDTTS